MHITLSFEAKTQQGKKIKEAERRCDTKYTFGKPVQLKITMKKFCSKFAWFLAKKTHNNKGEN